MLAMKANTNAASGIGSSNSTTAIAPGSAAHTFAEPVIAEGIRPVVVEPEFIAMPAPGKVCPYSSLQRGMLYALERDGLIKTVSLRRKGTTRGRRLIVLSSLKNYLRRLDAVQNAADREVQP